MSNFVEVMIILFFVCLGIQKLFEPLEAYMNRIGAEKLRRQIEEDRRRFG